MTAKEKITPFRLSRIYAQGWNAARTMAVQDNPYPTEPERGRWNAGFASARPDAEEAPE